MTDNGSAYVSHAFRAACQAARVKHKRTKPYTPRTNGKAERFIQTSAQLLDKDGPMAGGRLLILGGPEDTRMVEELRMATARGRCIDLTGKVDLLTAYATERVRKVGGGVYRPVQPIVLQIEEARERLERMLGKIHDWNALTRLLPMEWSGGTRRRSAVASTLLACLELARDGRIELQQAEAFAEIYVRDRAAAPGAQ